MTCRSFLILASSCIIILWCNCLMPMFGDDYLYAFIITPHTTFLSFDPSLAQRVDSFADIFTSQRNHYNIWGGRVISHSILQFFLWIGKPAFNLVNALVFVLLAVEIYWLVDRGRVSLDFKPSRLLWIFFALWIFSPGFSNVMLWMSGACNYLWTATILLAFLLPYVRQWFNDRSLEINPLVMLIAGVFAGWTNENTVCWFILALALMCLKLRAESRLSSWALVGLIGMSIGYAMLIFAPGNFERAALNNHNQIVLFDDLAQGGLVFAVGIWFQSLMWYFFLRTLVNQKKFGADIDVRRSLALAKTFALISLASNLIMFLAPEFNGRSVFPSTIYLIVAVTILIRLQNETKRNQLTRAAKNFLRAVGMIVFAFSFCSTVIGTSAEFQYESRLQNMIEREHSEGGEKILEFEILNLPEWLEGSSMYHLTYAARDEETYPATHWTNRTRACYGGVAGIRYRNDGERDDARAD